MPFLNTHTHLGSYITAWKTRGRERCHEAAAQEWVLPTVLFKPKGHTRSAVKLLCSFRDSAEAGAEELLHPGELMAHGRQEVTTADQTPRSEHKPSI